MLPWKNTETVIALWGVRADGSETWVVWWGDAAAARLALGPSRRVIDWPEFYAAYRGGRGGVAEWLWLVAAAIVGVFLMICLGAVGPLDVTR